MLNLQSQDQDSVVVTDVKMPFWSMVTFMVKLAFASIPATIIIFGVMMALTFGAIFFLGGLGMMAGTLSSSAGQSAVVQPSPSPTIRTIRAVVPSPTPEVEPTPTEAQQ